jgi:hypothetical protein
MPTYTTISTQVRHLLQQASADDPARAVSILAKGLIEVAEALEELAREVNAMP